MADGVYQNKTIKLGYQRQNSYNFGHQRWHHLISANGVISRPQDLALFQDVSCMIYVMVKVTVL